MKQPRDARKYLYDIAKACDLIKLFRGGKTLSDYSNDPQLRSAIERQLEIIGEALAQAIRSNPEIKQSITDAEKIIALRNRLIHAYFSISDETMWGIVDNNIGLLDREVTELLKKQLD